MSEFTIKKAERKAIPPLICVWGGSTSGKTRTSLLLARGYAGPTGKIGLIDTEHRRGEYHADAIPGGFDHLDLQPPFSPERFTRAFETFENAGGYSAVILDTTSHVWQGEGGTLDIADSSTVAGLGKWKGAKKSYNRFVNTVLRAPFAVFFCIRAKEGRKQIGRGKEAVIENIGLQPVMGRDFLFEMTYSVLLGADHCPAFQDERSLLRCDPLIPALKAPEGMMDIYERGKPLGIESGQRIRAWVDGGKKYDIDHAKLERDARGAAMGGVKAYKDYWDTLSKEQKASLAAIHDQLKEIAVAADATDEQSATAGGSDRTEPFQASGGPGGEQQDNSLDGWRDRMTALQSEGEFRAEWDKAPIDVCRNLGAAWFETQLQRLRSGKQDTRV